jgi:ribose transport system permease protein
MTILKKLQSSFLGRSTGIFIGLVCLMVVFSIMSSSFFTLNNIMNLTRQVSISAILAVGMTIAIIGGGIDLSVGSIVAFVSVIVASALVNWQLNMWLAILLGIALGALIGAINGVLISVFGIPPFIATLGTMTAFRGLTYLYTGGYPIYGLPTQFAWFRAGYVAGIPVPSILMFLIAVVVHFILNRTTFGRAVYAIGGNEEAARLSGIRVTRNKLYVYVASGALAAVSAIVLTSRLRSGLPTAGVGYELNAIAAVVLGGTSMSGGEGGVVGTLFGALLMGVLSNGLNLMNVDPYVLEVITGTIIVIAVLSDSLKKKKAQGK